MIARTRLITYAAILGALVVLFIVGSAFGPRRGMKPRAVFPGLVVGSVEAVSYEGPERSVTLRYSGEVWVLDEGPQQFPARADRIEPLLDQAGTSLYVRQVTSNPDLWGDFGLEDDQATVLTITSSGSLPDFAVAWGESAAEPGLSYIRTPGEPEVFATDGELGFYLQQGPTYWSYLRVLPEDLTVADAIAVTASVDAVINEEPFQVSYSWTRDEADWTAGGGERLDATSVDRVVRQIVDLVGRDFHRGPLPDGATAVGSILTSSRDGREFRLELFQFEEGFICRGSGPGLPGDPFGGLLYKVAESTVRQVFPDRETVSAD